MIGGGLLKGVEPDSRTGVIISVLTAADMLGTVVSKQDLEAAKARERHAPPTGGAKRSGGNWASDSVRRVIQDAQAAIAAAVMVSTTVVIAGGSG